MKRIIVAVLLTAAAVQAASAAEGKKTDPRYQREISKCRGKLGRGFTVRRVGMYVVASDLPEAKREGYEGLVRRIDAALYAKFLKNRPSYILKIALFRDNASLRQNAKKLAVKSAVTSAGGFFLPYEKVICLDAAMGEWLLKHELTHALLHADFRRRKLRPWIDEGMAMLLESAALKGDDITFRFDWRLTMAYRLMKSQKLPHLKDVFRMDFRKYNSRANRMTCDVVSRNVLMYLHEKGLLVTFYRKFRDSYRRDTSGISCLEALLAKKIDEIEADWLAWLERKATKRTPPKAKPPKKAQ